MVITRNEKDMIDLKRIPFSRYGSYFVVSSYEKGDGESLYIRDIHGGDHDQGLLFECIMADCVLEASPGALNFKGHDLEASICMPSQSQLMVKVDKGVLDLSYVLKQYDHIHLKDTGHYELTSYSQEQRYSIRTISGDLEVHSPWQAIGNTEIRLSLAAKSEALVVLIESYKVDPLENENYSKVFESFDQGLEMVEADYRLWRDKAVQHLPVESHALTLETADLASYILWMNVVRPQGIMTKPAMYMSNNWMTNIWSWDNCFGAIYLAKDHEALAWDQYTMFFDHQDKTGCYPDFINDTMKSYASLKPPIYGWAYRYMMKRNSSFDTTGRLKMVYESVGKMTEFWFNYRTKDGLPYYTHGNDSGWDNGTMYAEGMPVSTPDLMALLVDQMRFLSECASKLHAALKKEKYALGAKFWSDKAHEMVRVMTQTLYKDNKFYGKHLTRGVLLDQSDSLQAYLPLIISRDLEGGVADQMVKDLMDPLRFNGPYGLATEAMNSPYYESNGYWRGPVWAPTMLMFIDALDDGGYNNEAKHLATKYMRTLEKGGMAENHDPLTGEGLVDPAFAWTSAVYLILREEY